MNHRQYGNALKCTNTRTCSDEKFHDYVFSLCNNPSSLGAACVIKLQKLDYVEKLLHDYETSCNIKTKQYFDDFISYFFSIDLIPLLYQYHPEGVRELLDFQKRNFNPQFLGLALDSFTSFKRAISEAELTIQSDVIFNDLVEYLTIIHPSNFTHQTIELSNEDYVFSFTAILSKILLSSVHNKIVTSEIITLIFKLDVSYYEHLYHHLYQQFNFLKPERFSIHKDSFNLLFSHPKLCSLAFKENNGRFLPFCDVESAILKEPEHFA